MTFCPAKAIRFGDCKDDTDQKKCIFAQCTKGANGIAVNSKFEVLNEKGDTMPGLYAAGDTCTIYGGTPAGIGGGAEGASTDATPAMTPDGTPAASGANILSTKPYPCNGSSSALISGYY